MYSAERRQEILKLIEENAHVSVVDLAVHFRVSRASIRRDLNQLHRSGLLKRTYGGALVSQAAASASSYEPPFSERKISFLEEKERIGRAAAQLIVRGETVFIDGGTTTECMTPYLADKSRVTVVTYALNIANRLANYENLTLIVIGGKLHVPSQTFGGILALNNMQAYNMRFDKAFVAAGGVSAEAGVTNADLEQLPVKQRAVDVAHQTILLADSSKLGQVRTGLIAPAARIHRLITGAHASPAEIEALRGHGVVVDIV